MLNARRPSIDGVVTRARMARMPVHPAPHRGHPQPVTAWATHPPTCQGRLARRRARAKACSRQGSNACFAPYRIQASPKPTTSISSCSRWPSILRAFSLWNISGRWTTRTMAEREALAMPRSCAGRRRRTRVTSLPGVSNPAKRTSGPTASLEVRSRNPFLLSLWDWSFDQRERRGHRFDPASAPAARGSGRQRSTDVLHRCSCPRGSQCGRRLRTNWSVAACHEYSAACRCTASRSRSSAASAALRRSSSSTPVVP